MTLLITLCYILFVVSAIVLVIVVLLQEGKGGGLTDALGTGGQQTFGVGASGINKFTGYVGAVFLLSALFITVLNRVAGEQTAVDDFGQEQIIAPPADAPAEQPK
jgi:preprotein translocase subunit SecG